MWKNSKSPTSRFPQIPASAAEHGDLRRLAAGADHSAGTTTVTRCTRLFANPPRFHGCSTGCVRPEASVARAPST